MHKPSSFLITDKSNIRYLSNFTGSSGFMLLTKSKKYLLTDFRYIERAKNTIKRGIEIIDITKVWRNPEELKINWQSILKKHRIKLLGIEENNLTLTKYKKFKKISPKVKFSDISGTIEKLRETKSRDEISKIKKSQRINEKTFLKIKKIVQSKKSFTEKELAWKIKEFGNQFGAEDVSFEPIVAFGTNSAIVHHSSSSKKHKKGDLILIDMGMKYKGYCSDMTRIIFTKNPTPKQAEIYKLVLEAQEAMIQAIKAGITGKSADSKGRKIIEKAGYAENYGHSGGHGVGLDIHESPALSEFYTKKLKTNSVITAEPGIYFPKNFGIRIEDMILVTKKGHKNFTKIPKSIRSHNR